MSRIPNTTEMIDFLVNRKHGFRGKTAEGLWIELSAERVGRTNPSRASDIQEYKEELQGLTAEALQSAYTQEFERYAEEIRHREEQAERDRFFNQPQAAADLEHWCRAEHWTLDEAVALSFGKDPEVVNWKRIESLTQVSLFAKQYERRRDLALRAMAWKKLYDPVLPSIFFKWLKDNDIPVPADLAEKVARLRGKQIDWEKQYEELKVTAEKLSSGFEHYRAMHARHVAESKEIVAAKDGIIEAQQFRIAQLEAELIAALEASAAVVPVKPPSLIERQNMLTTIYSMAIAGYGYSPEERRSKVIPEIASDTAKAGFPVSDDTIRRYLKEALENADEWRKKSSD